MDSCLHRGAGSCWNLYIGGGATISSDLRFIEEHAALISEDDEQTTGATVSHIQYIEEHAGSIPDETEGERISDMAEKITYIIENKEHLPGSDAAAAD